MRLLNTGTLQLQEFLGATPAYAILSHTWDAGEVLIGDLVAGKASDKAGFLKLVGACRKAHQDGFKWIWIDTVCIQKASSAELSEAINSMYEWYAQSRVCYVYLHDVTVEAPAGVRDLVDDLPVSLENLMMAFRTEVDMGRANVLTKCPFEELVRKNLSCSRGHMNRLPAGRFTSSRWFKRGWTLQELLAPGVVEFYSSEWYEIGTKLSLSTSLSFATRIPARVLHGEPVTTCCVAQRMSWAANRMTTRIEDQAYSLLGLFGVNMPLLYGEGRKAFIRLQEEIMRQQEDYSILTWTLQTHSNKQSVGLLAPNPNVFSMDEPSRFVMPLLGEPAASTISAYLEDEVDYWHRLFFGRPYGKEYDHFRAIIPHQYSGAGVTSAESQRVVIPVPQFPPSLTSRGLRLALPVIRSKDPSAPVMAWIYCILEGKLLCILLQSTAQSALVGRASAQRLFGIDVGFLNHFVLADFYALPNGTISLSGVDDAKPTLYSDFFSNGEDKIDTKNIWRVNIAYGGADDRDAEREGAELDVYPGSKHARIELQDNDLPPIIKVLGFQPVGKYKTHEFKVILGLHNGRLWCQLDMQAGALSSTYHRYRSFREDASLVGQYKSSRDVKVLDGEVLAAAALRRSSAELSHVSFYILHITVGTISELSPWVQLYLSDQQRSMSWSAPDSGDTDLEIVFGHV